MGLINHKLSHKTLKDRALKKNSFTAQHALWISEEPGLQGMPPNPATGLNGQDIPKEG